MIVKNKIKKMKVIFVYKNNLMKLNLVTWVYWKR